ncbi:MAG: aminotransferase class IV [Verrucomicrobiales bacterium]
MKGQVIEGSSNWLDDRALTHGLGVFETMLVVEGRILSGEGHQARMREACRRLELTEPNWGLVEEKLQEAARLGKGQAIRARLMRTSGAGALGELRGEGAKTILWVGPCSAPPASVTLATAPWVRNERSPLVGLKCSSYAENLFALDRATKQLSADQLLFFNTRDEWCEATVANVFAVVNGELLTPPLSSGCLPGTQRERVLRMAEKEGIVCRAVTLTQEHLREVEDLFLTSATTGVVPVGRWDERAFSPSPMTRHLRDEWRREIGWISGSAIFFP